MRLETVEKWVRVAGAGAVLAFLAAMFQGLWRAWRQPLGTTTGPVPGFVRGYASGAWWFYMPGTVGGSALLYWLWRPLPLALSRGMRTLLLILGALLYFPGVALMLWGRFTLAEMYNVASSFGAQLYAEHRLVTAGPFRLVRHPMYLGGILAEVGAFLLYRTWATALILLNIPTLIVRSRREEEALSAQFGEQWVEYSQRVPALLPRLRG